LIDKGRPLVLVRRSTPSLSVPSDVTGKVEGEVLTPLLRYAHPWPDALPGLGHRRVGPFDPCASPGCERWSWVRYGDVVLCLACAKHRGRQGDG
jgi:hypothetical protein